MTWWQAVIGWCISLGIGGLLTWFLIRAADKRAKNAEIDAAVAKGKAATAEALEKLQAEDEDKATERAQRNFGGKP